MSRCAWIRRLCLLTLPALVLGVAASSSGSISPPGVVDTDIQGTWKGVYGTDGYILAAFIGAGVSGADAYSLPSYISSYTVDGLGRWNWATGTSDSCDLQEPDGSLRSIGCWYTGANGTITLVPNQSRTFSLRVYLRDPDNSGRWNNLSFTGAGLTGTDTVECTAGKWITYTVTATAGTNIVLTLEHQAGVNSTISALLFDPELGSDTTAPDAVSNLATSNPTANSITLTWTAPGNDGSTGTAAGYDIRYSTSTISEGNWASATPVTGKPAPAPAGTNQSMVVSGLAPSTIYYFALKARDASANISAISNCPSDTTTALQSTGVIALKRDAGLLAGGAIDPRFADAGPVPTTVEDAVTFTQQVARWYNGGTSSAGNGGCTFYRFDLASLPQLAYAKINLAQLRLYHTVGNGMAGQGGVSMVLTHDWAEGTKNADFPGAAGGVTYWAPIGYNTYSDQNPSGGASEPWGGWGLNSDSVFDMAVDAGPVVNPSSAPTGTGFHVIDVTSHVQTWVRGAYPNLGWAQNTGAYDCHLSESGADYQPVLFIDYASEGDTTPPATIANLATSNVTSSSVRLTWTAPGDDGSTGTAVGYEIRYATSPITAASWVLATPVSGVPAPQAVGTVQSLVVDGLPGGATYYFAIKASDEVPNVTPLSNVVSAQTLLDTAAPAAVSNLATSNATNHSLTLTWTAPGDDASTGTAAGYDVRYSTSTINEGNWASATLVTGEPTPTAGGTNQSLVIDNLTQNTTYYFAMKTTDEVPNTSGLSNVAAGQTLADTIAPGAVVNLTVAKAKSSALKLTWIASGDDGAIGTATRYDVRYSRSPLTDGNWASATQMTDEPAAVQPGYHRSMWITGLSAGTTYYVGLKAYDEVGNASTIATASATTPAASNLARPLLQPDDFEFLGAFKLPRSACGWTTAYGQSGIALRRVNGNLHFLSGTHVYSGDAIYECDFPGWGSDESTWPQSQVVHEWGTAVYGTPSMKPGSGHWTCGLNYDQATGRLYYSYGNIYNVSQTNDPSLGCAVLDEGGPIVAGPWVSQNVHVQVMRGGSLTIPDWFADTYLAGRKLGVGFGGGWSGWASCSPGPTLAAAHHPDASQTELDTLRLLHYDHDKAHWATRPAGYWWRTVPIYDSHLPDGDIGYWTSADTMSGACVWIDLADKQGLLYMTSISYGAQWYDYGTQDCDRWEDHWRVYDPADLADVAQSIKQPWEPPYDEWKVQGIPDPVNHRPGIAGLAFDAQTRTLFVIVAQSYSLGGQDRYPVVYGYRIKQSPIWKTGDINHDGYVNVGDLQALVAAWGSHGPDIPTPGTPASPNWNPDADINTDSFVNVGDLQLLVVHWGE